MTDLFLRAASSAALADALPMFRADLPAGDPASGEVAREWLTSSPHHALDPGVAVVETPAEIDGATVVTPAVLAAGWHMNLRLSPWHPGYDAIVAAAAPFVVTPTSPRQVFAGESEWGVPDSCTKLGLMRALREAGEWDEVHTLLQSDPVLWEEWQLATELRRSDPLVQGFIAARGYPPDRVDRLIIRATQLVA